MIKTRIAKKQPVTIKIVGLILSESYQRCKIFVDRLHKSHSRKFGKPSVKGYLDMDWVEYLQKLQRDLGGQTWAVKKHVVVFIDDAFIGGEKELFNRFHLYKFKLPPSETIKEFAKKEYLDYLNHLNLLYVFFELTFDDEFMGSLLFQLRPDLLPKTSSWFATLSDPNNRLGLTYKGHTISRVCRAGWLQGGKLNLGTSVGYLEDESLCYKHDRRGVLSLAKYGKDANRCQFFVTFKPSQWMDEYYVAFGRVVEGSDVLRRIENTKCTYEHPDHEIKIQNCGLAEVGLGRQLVTNLKLKGLTVGEPHIHLETFMDLVLDSFCEVLFERLDEEVRRQFHSEWIGKMIWDTIQPTLQMREPIADYPDVKDRSSRLLSMTCYFKGLYDLKEIPDLYIVSLLDNIISRAIEMSDTEDMARSIVDCIIDNLSVNGKASGVVMAESFVKRLSKTVDGIILKSHSQDDKITPMSSCTKRALFQSSISKVVSEKQIVKNLLSATSVSFEKGSEAVSEGRVSTKESVVRHVLNLLLDSFLKSSPES